MAVDHGLKRPYLPHLTHVALPQGTYFACDGFREPASRILTNMYWSTAWSSLISIPGGSKRERIGQAIIAIQRLRVSSTNAYSSTVLRIRPRAA
jgi:hypothetical protein